MVRTILFGCPNSDHAALNEKKSLRSSNKKKICCSKYNVTLILQNSKELKKTYVHLQQSKWFWIL